MLALITRIGINIREQLYAVLVHPLVHHYILIFPNLLNKTIESVATSYYRVDDCYDKQ